jgi:pimeloyl-ACP methyl ester carboxylesterase
MTEAFLNGGWEQAAQLAKGCAATMDEIGSYIGTGSVARDMMEIVDALGEDGLLRYYGWSYGSALGQYVAAMFPERIERMVLDGNVNPHTWQLGDRPEFLEATDKAFAGFVDECVKNSKDCSLTTALNVTTSAEIFAALNVLYAPLAENATTSMQGLSNLTAMDGTIYGSLYFPADWPKLAQKVADLLLGIVANKSQSSAPAPIPYSKGPDAVYGIRCSDATFQVPTPQDYLPILAQQDKATEGFKAVYTAVWPCAAWKMPSVDQYRGNFKTKTRHPILLINGEYDVVTPISGAYNASAAFEGSVVVAHTGYGHGIFPSPSKCVAKRIQRYFVEGVLPKKGIVCQPDMGPWEMAAHYAANNISRPY